MLLGLAGLYLALLAFDNTGYGVSEELPNLPRFFVQAACLFPDASDTQIEYRVEGWYCHQRRFLELDYRPYFPLRADDKESRLSRVGQFFRRNSQVMTALDEYLVAKHNTLDPDGEADGIPGLMGGIRLLSLRIPFPEIGEPIERYQRKSLDEYPDAFRKEWYETPIATRKARCGRP